MNSAPDTRHLTGAPPRLSSQAMAFVLAGGRGSRLEELTDRRAKPAVHFGGNSRIIDFPLSNALNSGVRKMAVATQYKAHSLIRHMQRGWGFFRSERNEYLDILPASQRVQENKWYLGTADAVTQNIDIVDDYDVEYVIILAGDHVYKMDYEVMLHQHVNTKADVTVGCLTVPREEATGFGVMHVNRNGRIVDFLEKPANPPGMPENPDMALASMGIYVFNWKFLRELLLNDAEDPSSSHDFGHDLIPSVVRNGSAYAHKFTDSCVMGGLETEPYWRDVGTIDSFWQANLDLTKVVPSLDLYDNTWPIWTYAELTPPAKFIHDDEARRGQAIESLISGNCILSGADVHRSLLFTGNRAHSFSKLDQVVSLPNVDVGRNADLTKCVIDSRVHIPEGLVVGQDPVEDSKWFRRTDSGVVLITQPMLDRRAAVLDGALKLSPEQLKGE
ncbi:MULTISPECIES: glucose-1-phosphate adenylyltransferase [Micrococcaceae]|uniref:glucose-1-phosphate adenylyltransferase n=1 Tax=Micrococcaceae TaxID=1268 RepID=UPI001035708B|nr:MULTISPECIES: glucose-1-phosphate adenylyltransferase [Micrococcaceae]TAP27514.1 glucose-1-phosphate adenylyltransferase [Arthrobacter sp. S41]UXN30815.1 glucose-1-phosphate adenylyltransferase [Glutamicibacter sp. M10]